MNFCDNDLYHLIQAVNKRAMFKTKADLEFIDFMLKDVSFFKDLRRQIGENLYLQILKELQYECHMPYEPQVNINDPSLKFYFIIEGKFIVLTKSILANSDLYISPEVNLVLQTQFSQLQPQSYLYAGQYFGEQVMMFDQTHTQTIVPLEKSHLIVIKRDIYRRIIESQSRKDEAEKFAFLSQVQLFSKWSAKTLRAVLPDIHEVNFISNQLIYSQNDPIDAVYIIAEGEVQLYKLIHKATVPIAILGCKECFGHDEILTATRSHSAKSLNCVRLYKIHKLKFLDHIPFDYTSQLDQKELYRNKHLKKILSVKNNPTMYLTPFQSLDPRPARSESLSIIKSPLIKQPFFMKKKDKSKTTSSLGSFQQVNELLRKNYRRFDSLIRKESSEMRQSVVSNSPTRRKLRMAFSPGEEISNDAHSRIHGGKFDKGSYLIGQMKLRSITQSTWNKQLKFRNE